MVNRWIGLSDPPFGGNVGFLSSRELEAWSEGRCVGVHDIEEWKTPVRPLMCGILGVAAQAWDTEPFFASSLP